MVTKTALPIVTAILLISLAGNWYFWQSARTEQLRRSLDNGRSQVEIAKHEAAAKSAAIRADSVEARRVRDSVSFKVSQNAAKREIEAYKKTIIRLRPLLNAKIDSFPDLREFVIAQDSTIEKQSDLIRDQEIFCTAQTKDLRDIILLTEQQLAAQREITGAVTQQLADSDHERRKERRGKKFFQWTTAIVTGVALYLAVKP